MVIKKETTAQRASRFFAELPDADTIVTVKEELEKLYSLVQKKPTIAQTLAMTTFSVAQKATLLKDELGDVSERVQQFIDIYLEQADLDQLKEAIETFLTLFDANKIEVITAIPLGREKTEQIARLFQKKVGKEYGVWVNIVDQNVLGGVMVKTNEQMLDATVLAQLKSFEMELKLD